jgi:hypothetical protein
MRTWRKKYFNIRLFPLGINKFFYVIPRNYAPVTCGMEKFSTP